MSPVQLLLPDVEPAPRPIDHKPRIIKVASDGTPSTFREGFALWLDQNWSIWLRFEFEASKVRERGRAHYSARTIGEYIRHSTSLRERKPTFKCNDWWWPDCARLYMLEHPEAKGFFDLRGRQ